jgi:hypothetical protein
MVIMLSAAAFVRCAMHCSGHIFPVREEVKCPFDLNLNFTDHKSVGS